MTHEETIGKNKLTTGEHGVENVCLGRTIQEEPETPYACEEFGKKAR